MTETEQEQAPVDGAVFSAEDAGATQRAGREWRRYRFWVLCAAAFILLSVIGFILANASNQSNGTLSITNPAPAGAQAAAEVLRNRGVAVTATDSLADTSAALSANGHGNSTVLFYDPENILSPAQAAELSASVKDAGGTLVAISPAPLAVKKLSVDIASAGTAAGTSAVPAGCSNPDASSAGAVDGGSPVLGALAPVTLPVNLYLGAGTCYFPDSGNSGGFLALDSTGDIAALGNPAVIINQNLANRGNAALTFRLLGSKPNLLWYTASLKDVPLAEQPPTLAELTPGWIFPASSWLLVVALVGMLWKGRRNGPLVTEPLPVVVKASETLTGRARLYQDAKALGTASRTLQHATMTRLARTLRLGLSAEPDAVVEAVAAATSRSRQQVAALLTGQAPRTEKDMLSMAVELTALEEEVAQR
ncbi:DUF4350 domain-containing protein [Arthrobacter sp. LAPM80]|uniref:DUF4350 domain-containing protein n=1 Tax=Arthrobacter sp. LAPM80 TaxID=3141788 RepID=UPI00398ACF62